MKLMRPRTFIIYGLAALAGVALLHTSQQVQRAEEQRDALQASIEREKERIRMLEAEWVHLNRPERLEALAEEFLDLAPPASSHIVREDIFAAPEPELAPETEVQPVSYELPPERDAIPVPVKPQAKPEIKKQKETAPAPVPLPKAKRAPTRSFDNLLEELGGGQ